MSGRRNLALACFILGGGCWSSRAAALENEPPSVWYRSADGCPDGAAFIGRLHGAAEGAKLAGAANRIDFVVTLGAKDGRAFGRLERQTSEGRAAVREVAAKTCEEVADAVALTLTLALEPPSNAAPQPNMAVTPANSASPAPSPGAPAATPSTPAAVSAAPVDTRATQATTHAVALRTPPPSEPTPAYASHARTSRWLVGNDFSAEKGSLSDPLLGDRLFVELRPNVPWHGSSLRAGLFATRRTSSKDPPVELERFGGRLEACPFALFGPAFELSPCLGFDAGSERARGTSSTGVSNSAVWLAASGFARGVWQANRLVSVEAAAGPTFPLTRYDLVTEGSEARIHRTEVIGLSVALGAAFRLW